MVVTRLRAEAGDRAVTEADARNVAALLRELDAVAGWSQPLGVMLCAVLHFAADHREDSLGPGAHAIAEVSAAYDQHGLRLVWPDEEQGRHRDRGALTGTRRTKA